ncbi:MAG TPA: glycogen debranching protein GlgX [Gemmatimonadales bacterium]|nr:glycogen debranching protein GlgX [Gemmatimonadales bacterium]
MSRIGPGAPAPLGVTWDGRGSNVAVFSEHATRVELCRFARAEDTEPVERITLPERTGNVWHGSFPQLRPGALYGFRADGPWDPDHGHRFNPAKLLLDPYAYAVTGPITWHETLYDHHLGDGDAMVRDDRDSAAHMPKAVVVDHAFTWNGDAPPRTPWGHTVIYECHVKGMTMQHPEVPEEWRGTYLGLASPPILEHLRALGVTAVELLPVQQAATEPAIADRGLVNYWGYNTIGFFAPDVRYATAPGRQVDEFKTMVRHFHDAGIEVILDVVYNHTAEGGRGGPTLSFRGLENAAYYRLVPDHRREYVNDTGTGNTWNAGHPRARQLVLDSLRHWVREMHVDGFRFDIATVLGREHGPFDAHARFFELVRQDPVLSRVKLIAEPWDIGDGGYQLGHFPAGWSEWNDRYRDTMRRFWRGEPGLIGQVASCLAGSSDLFSPARRGPHASVNYVACHDGLTLRDLVSYEEKHNEANGEENRDGHNANFSRNWGVEGPTDSPRVRHHRDRTMRNLMATLAFSLGVPMLAHGDELGRTQQGNNNAYCQDNPLTWVDWTHTGSDFQEFVGRVLALRAGHPTFRRHAFLQAGVDVAWIRSDGGTMTDAEWGDPRAHTLGMLLQAETPPPDAFLLLLNGGGRSERFALPPMDRSGHWTVLLNTVRRRHRPLPSDGAAPLVAHSLMLLGFESE